VTPSSSTSCPGVRRPGRRAARSPPGQLERLPDAGAQVQDVDVAVLSGSERAGAGRPDEAVVAVPGRRWPPAWRSCPSRRQCWCRSMSGGPHANQPGSQRKSMVVADGGTGWGADASPCTRRATTDACRSATDRCHRHAAGVPRSRDGIRQGTSRPGCPRACPVDLARRPLAPPGGRHGEPPDSGAAAHLANRVIVGRPRCSIHTLSRPRSAGSGRSRHASSASSGCHRRCSMSTACCLLYLCMAVIRALCQPDATVADASGRVAAPLEVDGFCDYPPSGPNRPSLYREALRSLPGQFRFGPPAVRIFDGPFAIDRFAAVLISATWEKA
jgi:hypothetical protein